MNQYKLSLRFDDEVLEAGFTAIPNILRANYADLGMSDGEYTLVTHLLAHQWTSAPPHPRLANLPMTANEDTRRRYVRHLREAGLLFTRRIYKDGKVDRQEYHMGSLWWNLRRLVRFKENWKRPRFRAWAIDHGFQITIPEWMMARIVRGFYHDVPQVWKERAAEHAGEIIARHKRGEPIPPTQRWAILGSCEGDEEKTRLLELEEMITLAQEYPVNV